MAYTVIAAVILVIGVILFLVVVEFAEDSLTKRLMRSPRRRLYGALGLLLIFGSLGAVIGLGAAGVI